MTKFGLIGHPIAHSGSPALFARAYGGRWPYELIEGNDFDVSWQRFLDSCQAVNITAPFKEDAFSRVMRDGVPDTASKEIGAINIAVKEADGLVHGYNSDCLGVLKILRDKGFGHGSTVLVAGFGGAGKAAAAASRAAGCDTIVCNRSIRSGGIRPLDELPILATVADLLIYTLPAPVPQAEGLRISAILEANYKSPCLSEGNIIRTDDAPFCGYIPGSEWLMAQAVTGYPLMTGETPSGLTSE